MRRLGFLVNIFGNTSLPNLLESSSLLGSSAATFSRFYSTKVFSINMNSKHLAAGSSCPPSVEGKLRIYNMRFCPYAQRAILVAEAKEIPNDIVNVNLKQKPEWLFEKNPYAKVPTIDTPKGPLYESLIVSDYVDEVFPGRKLNSADPFRRAEDRILIERFSQVISSYYKILKSFGKEEEEIKAAMKEMTTALEPFEEELKQRSTRFFGGAQPGMVDYMIWPWLERFPVMKIMFPNLFDFEQAKQDHPLLESWRKGMKEDPATKSSYVTPEDHTKFFKTFLEGNPDYDFLSQ